MKCTQNLRLYKRVLINHGGTLILSVIIISLIIASAFKLPGGHPKPILKFLDACFGCLGQTDNCNFCTHSHVPNLCRLHVFKKVESL